VISLFSTDQLRSLRTPAVLIALLGMSLLSGCASSSPAVFSPFRSNAAPTASMVTYIPVSQYAPHDVYHEVGPFESVWSISKTYNVDMETIMRVNHITDPSQIKKGRKLLIPNTMGPRSNILLFPTTRWTHIVIHHTATDDGNALYIDKLHHERGWENGMGYHFLIDNGTRGKTSGQIEVGPRWKKQMQGAHTKQGDWNQKAIGIAVVGNYSETGLPETMLAQLIFLVETLKTYYRIPDQNILGHRDVPGAATECPGKFFPWSEFKRRIRVY